MKHVTFAVLGLTVFATTLLAAPRGIKREVFAHHWDGGSRYLKIEALMDRLVHVEVYERRGFGSDNQGPNLDPIYTTPMVDASTYGKYQGPEEFRRHGDGVETTDLRITHFREVGCVKFFDKKRNRVLTELCANDLMGNKADYDHRYLNVLKSGMWNVYGVGNLFYSNDENGDWTGRRWDPRKRGHGNFRFGKIRDTHTGILEAQDSFYDGGPSVSQFPMLYVLGPDKVGYGLMLDQVERVGWEFPDNGDVWTAAYWGDELRYFFFAGDDVQGLRTDYMNLTGKPRMPPKSVLGQWTSEFGYDSWKEVEQEIKDLRKEGFPLDGLALDLQWFGGVFGEENVGDWARMGALTFVDKNKWGAEAFPNPSLHVDYFFDQYGVSFMPIEESYIDNRLLEYGELEKKCYLAHYAGGCNPVTVSTNFNEPGKADAVIWWGRGGYLDHTHPDGRGFWHQWKRHPLNLMGIFAHWMDLGEPEMYYQHAHYHGVKKGKHLHGDIHNVFNLMWAQGIQEGYDRAHNRDPLIKALNRLVSHKSHQVKFNHPPRHYTMSRSGTIGSHRYGGMWSGDTYGNFQNLRAHLNTQMNMSMVGVDYYGSDAGGFFHGGRAPWDQFDRDVYTRWYSVSSLLDTPLRPHAWAIGDSKEQGDYSADLRGDKESNRANAWRRYELIPYLYTFAHRAHKHGEAIFPPVFYHFQSDPKVREAGNIKMIGDALLFATHSSEKGDRTSVYLPKGTWVDYESGDYYRSNGRSFDNVRLIRDEHRLGTGNKVFMNPLFMRGGAIIPKMHVDWQTMNVYGKREDNSRRDELILKIAPSNHSTFQLYEDDGLSRGYEHNEFRTTKISQFSDNNDHIVEIEGAKGTFVGASPDRENVVELMTDDKTARSAQVNGKTCVSLQKFLAEPSQECWVAKGPRLIRVGTRRVAVDQKKTIKVEF